MAAAPPWPSSPETTPTQVQLASAMVHAALAVRSAVERMPVQQRVQKAPSPLKPPPATSALPDLVGEQVAFTHLQALATHLASEVRVVVDPASGRYHALTPASSAPPPEATSTSGRHIWAYLDAVDGTLKLSGLGNAPGVARVVNDGSWAVGLALTEPTRLPLEQLRIGDFSVACILDGSAPLLQVGGGRTVAEAVATGSFPPVVLAFRVAGGGPEDSSAGPARDTGFAAGPSSLRGAAGQEHYSFRTYAVVLRQREDVAPLGAGGGGGGDEVEEQRRRWEVECGPRLHTTSITQLNQTFAFLDAFQAFDRQTQEPGDEQLACALFAGLMNRHEGGAFDVLRSYGNLSSLLRTLLGWGDGSDGDGGAVAPRLEPACGAYVAVNENLANLLPSVPVVLGAGGVATDLSGRPLAGRTLAQGRTGVMYAGNAELHARLLDVVRRCRGRPALA